MTVHTVADKKRLSEAVKVFVELLPGRVSLGAYHSGHAQQDNDQPTGKT